MPKWTYFFTVGGKQARARRRPPCPLSKALSPVVLLRGSVMPRDNGSVNVASCASVPAVVNSGAGQFGGAARRGRMRPCLLTHTSTAICRRK